MTKKKENPLFSEFAIAANIKLLILIENPFLFLKFLFIFSKEEKKRFASSKCLLH